MTDAPTRRSSLSNYDSKSLEKRRIRLGKFNVKETDAGSAGVGGGGHAASGTRGPVLGLRNGYLYHQASMLSKMIPAR